jgi:hypothetical protein
MFLRNAGLFALVFVFSAAIAEASMIDSFDGGSQSLFVTVSQPDVHQQVNAGSGTIGSYRDISLLWNAGFLDYANVMVSGSSGMFGFNQLTSDSTGKATITWDGSDSPNVLDYKLDQDLTLGGDNGFLIDIGTSAGMTLTMTVYTNATSSSSYTKTLASGFSGLLYVPYSSFAQVGTDPAEFDSIGAIQLLLDGTAHPGSNIAISSIQTVPEPSAFAMLVVGAVALLGIGRRSRRAQ